MNTIKIYLAESGRIADLHKDFPLYQGQYQNKLLNIFVPTSIVAPEFISQDANGVVLSEYIASTAVKIGMSYTARNGTIKVSKNYYMRYLKTLTYQGVEYALYERKLPQEFTLYAGQGSNAPVMTINVVNIQQETEDDTPVILSIITSQNCSLDVMPSTSLDNDEAIEPSELDNIIAQLNEINEILPTKQDKEDEALETEDKTVVGAINENKSRIDTNEENIETNRQNIATNRNDIDWLKENIAQPEEYIGTLTGTTLPTDSQLNAFVEENTDPSREPKNADVVIFILEIQGATDKNYKYIYSVSGWRGLEIPPMEEASNGTLGIVKGTYSVGSTNDTLVDISGGEILNIYVKDSQNTYRNIREYLNTTKVSIDNIINGTTSVGNALKAVADGLGNNIVNTYLTQNAGATKDFVKDYALPKVFNDVFYITSDGYSLDVPTDADPQFTHETSAIGETQIFEIERVSSSRYELSKNNSYSNKIYITADRDVSVVLKLTTSLIEGTEETILNVELSNTLNLVDGEIQGIVFNSQLSSLGEDVVQVNEGDKIRQSLNIIVQDSTTTQFDIYSNTIYPSTFQLQSTTTTKIISQGELGEQRVYEAIGTLENDTITFELDEDAEMYENTEAEFKFNYDGLLDDSYELVLVKGTESYRLVTPYNASGNPTIKDFVQVTQDETGWIFKGFIEKVGSDFIVRVDVPDMSNIHTQSIEENGHNIYGVILGDTDPTNSTTGATGQHYINITSGKEFYFNGTEWKGIGTTSITEIILSGESGTLTDAQFALLQENPLAVVFSLNGKKYWHNEDAETFITYWNKVFPTTTTEETKVIYVNTTPSAVNYKSWSVETEEPSGGSGKKYLSLERLGAYIYKITFDTLPEYQNSVSGEVISGCSSFVKDGKLYRNLDWRYDNTAEFEVITKNFRGMAFISGLNDGSVDERVEQAPYHMVDGINNDGIMASTHILFNDWEYEGSGDKNVDLTTIVFHILNELHDINDISTVMTPYLENISIPQGLITAEYIAQFLVSDGTTTYAILPPTTADGSWSITDISALPKLTNFRWLNKATIQRDDADLQSRPTGIERWNLIESGATLEELRFTLAYESPDRLSEFIGIDDTTKDSTDQELLAIYNLANIEYLDRERDGVTWQTVHSVVYGNKQIDSLFVQENYEVDYIAKGGSGEVLVDNTTISKNTDGELQSIGLTDGTNGLTFEEIYQALTIRRN